MALGNDQKQRILYHLNIPGLSIVESSTHYNSIINDRLSDINNDIQDVVEGILICTQEAEDALKEAKKCLKVAQVGDIRMNTDHLENLKFEYNRQRRKLANTLDLPFRGTGTTGIRV